MDHLTVLTAGNGGARFVAGLVDVRPEESVHVLANVGDDCELWGLHCAPDVDLVVHTLSGERDPYDGDRSSSATYDCFETMRRLGLASWLRVSDQELATLLLRTSFLKSGSTLEEANGQLAERFGVGVTLILSSSDAVRTTLHTAADGELTSLEYRARQSEVSAVETLSYEGSATAQTSSRAIDSILAAERVILAPADPELGIGAFLALPDLRNALGRTRASVVAISPIIGSQHARGAGDIFADVRADSGLSVVRFAEGLQGVVDSLVIHTTDLPMLDAVRATGIDAWADNILINTREDAARLAGRVAFKDRLVARKR